MMILVTNFNIMHAMAYVGIGVLTALTLIAIRGLLLIVYARFFPYNCVCEVMHMREGRTLKNSYQLDVVSDWKFNLMHIFRYRFFMKTPSKVGEYIVCVEKRGHIMKAISLVKPINSDINRAYSQMKGKRLKYNFLELKEKYYEVNLIIERK